jgi:hypothetical protein
MINLLIIGAERKITPDSHIFSHISGLCLVQYLNQVVRFVTTYTRPKAL